MEHKYLIGYLFTYFSTYVFIYLFIYLFILFIYLFSFIFIYLFIYPRECHLIPMRDETELNSGTVLRKKRNKREALK